MEDSSTMAEFDKSETEKVFNHFDTNGDGKISSEEFSRAIRSIDPKASNEELKKMMEEMDTDGNGFIDMKEFSDFLLRYVSGGGGNKDRDDDDDVVDLVDAFKTYDLDGDGFISAEELEIVMKRLNHKCSLADCYKMIKGVDENGDGKVDFGEFKKMMKNNNKK